MVFEFKQQDTFLAKYRSGSLADYLVRPPKMPRVQNPEGSPSRVRPCSSLWYSKHMNKLVLADQIGAVFLLPSLPTCQPSTQLPFKVHPGGGTVAWSDSGERPITIGGYGWSCDGYLGAAPRSSQLGRAVTIGVAAVISCGLVVEEVVSLRG